MSNPPQYSLTDPAANLLDLFYDGLSLYACSPFKTERTFFFDRASSFSVYISNQIEPVYGCVSDSLDAAG